MQSGRVDLGQVDAYCVTRDTLERRQRIGDVPMVYEPTGRRQAFWFDAGFAGQLDTWVGELAGDLGQPAARLDTYGSWIDGRGQCDSWHHSGRAFDLAGIRLADGGVVSCRYDQLRDRPAAELEAGLPVLLGPGGRPAPAVRVRADLPLQRPARQPHPPGQRPLRA